MKRIMVTITDMSVLSEASRRQHTYTVSDEDPSIIRVRLAAWFAEQVETMLRPTVAETKADTRMNDPEGAREASAG